MDRNEKNIRNKMNEIYDVIDSKDTENAKETESSDELNTFDILISLSVFAAIGAGIISYFLPDLFGGLELCLIPLAIVTVLMALAGRGLKTGELWVRGGSIMRAQNPVAFWIFVAFYMVAALLFIIAIFFL